MKVLIKFDGNVFVLENVGMDEKCLPLVEGIPPYLAGTRGASPLVTESVLWFKSLALDAIYIDCHQRLVYWTALGSKQHDLKQTPAGSISNKTHFVPSTARPLFTDKSDYDFDATPKEMIIKCCEVARKYSHKVISTEEFHKIVARILHVYILPSIVFMRGDLSCLLEVKSQIEKRLNKAEADIRNCATVVENLKQCLSRMTNQLLEQENMDSEHYLRNCKKYFLLAFLKVVTLDADNLNTELSAAQSNLNWAREHSGSDQQVANLRKRRDDLFVDIDKRIMAREALKNVIMRRELTKKKVKKCSVINNCVHNVFVEVLKKLEAKDHILCQLGKDKVSICAVREAVLGTLAEITESSHNSDPNTKFELHNFVDCQLVGLKVVDKSDDWLTLRERVTNLLNDELSVTFMYHESGCKELASEIHKIQSGLPIIPNSTKAHNLAHLHKSHKVGHSRHLSLTDRQLTNPEFGEESLHERNAAVYKAGVFGHFGSQQATNFTNLQALGMDAAAENNMGSLGSSQAALSRSRSAVSLKGSQCEVRESEFSVNWYTSHIRAATSVNDISEDRAAVTCMDDISEDRAAVTCMDDMAEDRAAVTCMDDIAEDTAATPDIEQSADSGIWGEGESAQKVQQPVQNQEVMDGKFLESVDSLRRSVQVHFKEVIQCLGEELEGEDNWDISFQEHLELLWKSYQHFFCQDLHGPLLQLYTNGFTSSVRQAYTALCGVPVQEILKGDKLLDLFFGHNSSSSKTAPIPIACPDQLNSQILTDQCLSQGQCYINSLYYIVHGDDEPHLGDTRSDGHGVKGGSCGSCFSTTPSSDEGFGAGASSFSSSVQSDFSVSSLDEDIKDGFGEVWKVQSSTESVEEVFDSVLSSFRLHINKCLTSDCFLDKVRFIIKAIEVLNNDVSQMSGPGHVSACDDIISMLVLALCHISEEMFIDLYVNLRLLTDVLPSFLTGSLWDYNLVSLCASYDYLFTFRMCDSVGKERVVSQDVLLKS